MVGLRCTSGWKSHRVMPWHASSPSAVTVAERAPPSIRAISPKCSPAPSVRRNSPPTVTVAVPDSMR